MKKLSVLFVAMLLFVGGAFASDLSYKTVETKTTHEQINNNTDLLKDGYYFGTTCGDVWECTSGCINLTNEQNDYIWQYLNSLCGTDIIEVEFYF